MKPSPATALSRLVAIALLMLIAALAPHPAAAQMLNKDNSIRDALAQSIVLNAEAKANKHNKNNASPASVTPAAKTKNFSYTQISVPSAPPQVTRRK